MSVAPILCCDKTKNQGTYTRVTGRSPREGKSYPLQYSGLENSMDCIVYGVARSQSQLSDFHM